MKMREESPRLLRMLELMNSTAFHLDYPMPHRFSANNGRNSLRRLVEVSLSLHRRSPFRRRGLNEPETFHALDVLRDGVSGLQATPVRRLPLRRPCCRDMMLYIANIP
jgi:hypothetical protein